jgi:hypothetical protein
MRELFVYYRIRNADAAAARAAVRTMQDGLRQTHAGLEARLLSRAGDGDELQTWMETYSLANSAEGIAPGLEARIEAQAAAWSHLLAGPRHIEAFVADGDG